MKAYVAALPDLPCELYEPQPFSQNRRAAPAYCHPCQVPGPLPPTAFDWRERALSSRCTAWQPSSQRQ